MSGFINNLISRHLEPDMSVSPRLPGRFESVDKSANYNQIGSFSFTENQPEQFPAGSAGNNAALTIHDSDIKRNSKRQTDKSNIGATLFHSPQLENRLEKGFENQNNSEMPGNYKFSQNKLIINDLNNITSQNNKMPEIDTVSGTIEDKVNQKKKHLLVSGSTKTHSEEEMINEEKERTAYSSKSVLPQNLNQSDDNKIIKLPSEKSGGAFGDPPGALSNSRIPGNKRLENFHPDIDSRPVIKVSIGQINVRAVTSTPLVVSQKSRGVPKQSLTLEDYLKQRSKD